MPLLTMSSLTLTILLLFNLLPYVTNSINLRKIELYYFLFSTTVLYGFNLRIYPELELNVSIILVLITSCILFFKCGGKVSGKLILISVAFAFAAAVLGFFFGQVEWLVCLYGLFPVLSILLTGSVLSGLCTAATIPVLIELFRFILELMISGYAFAQFGASVADSQLIGFLITAVISELLLFRKNKLENKRI